MVSNSGAVIIIIDHDPAASKLLSRRLKQCGYQTRGFLDASQAVKWIRRTPPDLIIADAAMPGLNGFDLCDLVRHSSNASHIPIIVVTDIAEARKQLAGLSHENIYCLSKPVDHSDLSRLVERALHFSFED